MPEIVVTKLAAASRQLNCAVELYFENGDPVAIHTLVCAAHQVISDINRSRKGPQLLFDWSKRNRKDWSAIFAGFRKHANYFKHAESDPCPNCGIRFPTEITEVIMLSAILGLSYLEGVISATQSAYVTYMQLHKDSLFQREWCKFEIVLNRSIDVQSLSSLDKEMFFDKYISAVESE